MDRRAGGRAFSRKNNGPLASAISLVRNQFVNLSNLKRKVRLRTRLATVLKRFTPLRSATSPLRVLTSLPRSGTHWLKHMISQALGVDPLERRINGPDTNELIEALTVEAPYRLIYDHFDFDLHGSILNPSNYPRLKIVLLYRHPLDALISQFYTRLSKGTLPDPSLSVIENLKLYITNKTKPNQYPWPLREYIYHRVVGWFETGYCLPVRYEDLVQDAPGQLARVLEYLQVPATPTIIQNAIEQNQFKVLSGGRRPGEVDPTSHYRRGLPGEWREVMTADEMTNIEEQIGDYLRLLGYPLEKLS